MKIKSDKTMLFSMIRSLCHGDTVKFDRTGGKYEYNIPNGMKYFWVVDVSREKLLKYLKRKKIKFSVVEMIETIEEVMNYYDFLDMVDIVAAIDSMKECVDNPEAIYNYCKMHCVNETKSLYPYIINSNPSTSI